MSRRTIENINNMLQNDFYQDREITEITSIDDLTNLPTIRKDDLVEEENFVMFDGLTDEALTFNYTSGTTKHPTIVLRSDSDNQIEKEKASKNVDLHAGDRNYVVISSTIALTGTIFALRDKGVFSGYSTPYNLEFAAQAIDQLEIDTLWSTPSLALKIGEMMKENSINRNSVEKMVLTGEPLSELVYKKLDDLFSGLEVYMDYGSIETGHLGYQCSQLEGTNIYHPFTDKFVFELMDFDEDSRIDQGYGELTVTKAWQNCCLPLVRYRMGDKAKWVEDDCSCGEKKKLEIGGRTVFDSFKMTGFTLYKENFEDALGSVADLIGPTYQIHIKEVEKSEEIAPMLEVHLTPAESLDKELIDIEEIEDSIANNFKVTSSNSYRDMSEKGIFSDLKVMIKESVVSGAKTKPIVDHRTT